MALTPDESKELQRLLAKAKSMATPPSLEVEHSEFGVYDPNTGLFFNPVTGDVDSVWDSEFSPTAGAMTDGSKRREDEFNHPPAKKSVAAKSQAAPYGSSSRGAPLPYVFEGLSSGIPLPESEIQHITGKFELPEMPADIPDVETWGRTLISFGTYKDSNLSYLDLVSAEDSRTMNYVKWCRARGKTAQGQLRDLCNYMMHFFQDDLSTGHQIPGTSQVRRLKQ